MGLLALAWYEYISIIAGVIVAVGGAIGVLTNWGRGVVIVARRLLGSRRQPPPETAEPSEEQREVLNAVYRHFLEEAKRAPFRQLDKELDRAGIELRKNAESMPPGLLTPDVRPRGGFFYADDELMVTLEGIRYCDGGHEALDLIARVLADMARREKAFMPTADQPDLMVRSEEVAETLGLSPLEVAQARHLLDMFEPHVWVSANWAHSGEWTVTLELERARRFRGVENGDEYLLARTGEQSFSHRLQDAEPLPRFRLTGEVPSFELGSGPVCLRVDNEGPSDDFEATVVEVQGSKQAAPPWHVRWRGSSERRQEILAGHHWMLEVCTDDAMHGADGPNWTPGWLFLRPDGETFLAPDGIGSLGSKYGLPLRATIKITPRSQPQQALGNTVTVSINEQGRSVLWDLYRVPSTHKV
jgi:hypothetical protein